MKKIVIGSIFAALGLVACDHVDNPFPEQIATELDYSLYPGGDSVAYAASEWPTFTANTNTLRNLMIEDFTGHKCVYCAPAGDTAHLLHTLHPGRVFTTAIHAGPGNGSSPAVPGSFQTTDNDFTLVLYNQEGLEIGSYFGSIPGTSFNANPSGNVSRITSGGQIFGNPSGWRSLVDGNLNSTLKVNIQSHANYYPSTRGLFLHTEIDVLDNGLAPENLYTVVYLVEDSIIGKQKMPPPIPTDDFYVHRDVMRGCIGSSWKGRTLGTAVPVNGKYYFNYSYALPAVYNPSNMHLLIYVRDSNTEEIYQVIEQEIE